MRALIVALVGLLVVALAVGAPAGGSAASAEATRSSGPVKVIVQKWWAADRGPELAVQRLGGRVTRALPLVAGFAATLPGGRALADLAGEPGVRTVTPDQKVHVQGMATGGPIRSVYPKVVRADDAWRNGVTGQGITVAVVDTGIANVPDLAGRIVQINEGLGPPKPCKNLSGELNCDDAYGHGTFVAGSSPAAGPAPAAGGRASRPAPGCCR